MRSEACNLHEFALYNYIHFMHAYLYIACIPVVSSCKESCNIKPMYGYMLPNLSPSLTYTKYCLQ